MEHDRLQTWVSMDSLLKLKSPLEDNTQDSLIKGDLQKTLLEGDLQDSLLEIDTQDSLMEGN